MPWYAVWKSFFATLDFVSGYWQIEIAPEDQKKTAFITKYGLFEHKMMCFGLCNGPATFQRAMQFVLSGLLWDKALCYLDDVISLGSDFESAIANLREIFGRFRDHNLKMKPKKCGLFQEQVEYLGRLVSYEGVAVRPGPIFCLLLGVSSGCARPITGQVTLVTWPVIGWA